MYLKRLEMQGFKSFADRTIFEFKNGITAVIGPNGSGKSNISDAIRWVLGEQSMKSLRGAKSEDVIFAGTENRKSLGFAEVNMVIDNSDERLPIEYKEVTVTRKLYRTGETGYYINKVPCRLKDILELFMDTGIGKDGYSIIGQGKIDEILSNKSEDRRHIFEEAAGIVKYKVRKEESEKKLEQTKVNLIRINDILAEIEANLEPLKEKADKAKKFLNLKEELKNIEIGLFVQKIENYKEKLKELLESKEIFENQQLEEQNKQDEMQKIKENLKIEIEKLSETIEKIQELGYESKNKIEKINSDININKEKISNNIENISRIEQEITLSIQNIENMQEEKKGRIDKKESLQKNKEKFSKELEEKEQELSKIVEKLSSKELQIEEKKKVVETNKEEKYKMQNEITEQDVIFSNLENRKKQYEKELSETISELDKKRTAKNEFNNGFLKLEKEKIQKEEEIKKEKQEKEKIEEKIKKYDEKIIILTDSQRLKQTKCTFLIETEREKEGYTKTVKEILKACEKNEKLKEGICGVLANIIYTDDKYQTAIEMALGATLQNIVTKKEEDAKKMIEYLRKNNLGRASFLPISSVHGKKIDNVKKMDGFIGIASDLVKYSKEYEGIILSLLGKTVIVDNMENAIKIAKENKYLFRIVTLDGDIINPYGAISGGSVSKKTVNILGRNEEIKKLEKEIKDIQKEIETLVEEKEKLKNENNLKTFEESVEILKQIEINYATEKEKLAHLENEILELVKKKELLNKEIQEIDVKKKESINKKEKIKEEISKVEKEIEELTKEIEEYAKLNKDNQKYIDDLNFEITNLKISVSSFDESSLSMQEILDRIENSINLEQESVDNKKKQIENMNIQNENLEKDIESLKKEIENINKELENKAENVENKKREKIDKTEKLNSIEKEIENKFEILQEIKEQIVKVDMKKTSIEQDITEVTNNLWEEYEITPNNAKDYPKPENIQTSQKKVNELHEKIKNLGSVNVDSIEEYKNTKERYENMSEQRLDLETTMTKLRNVINEMTGTMKKQFKEKFKEINKNFNEVFIELFGGGKAELVLEDENNILESGIDIKAQPTGKKLQNMMLLSGGEKALTAIALLFAILKINPAPFCILDEIEAALDDVNVYRFAEYLKKFSMTTQFLVITHRKGTMEAADTVYGVTMEENGISKLLSIKLSEVDKIESMK